MIESHTIARAALRAGSGFAVVAAVWSAVVLVRGGSWWGPLHAFLAGTVLLAISGTSQMFTVTWAAAPAPSRVAASGQRWLAIVGAAAVLVGVSRSLPALTWAGAGALAAALLLLAWSIRQSVRRSLLRRFDLSSRFYLVASMCGVVGVTLGGLLATGTAGGAFAPMRIVHSHLNLVGFVGLTIVGTLPTFLPTVAHHRAVSGREATAAWAMGAAGAVAMAAGLWTGPQAVGAGTILVGASAASILAGILARLWRAGRKRPEFVQICLGTGWLIVWSMVDGTRLLAGAPSTAFGGWTAAAILAGVGQVLAGSLAYLLPVLAGPPLADNLARMTSRPWTPWVAANLAGAALVTANPEVAVAAAILWGIDFAVRVASLRRGPLVPSE